MALDELTLADGRHVHGRLLEKAPGRWVIVETEDGSRRTFAWQLVNEIVEAPVAKTTSPTLPRDPRGAHDPWRTRGGFGMNYDLRIELAGLIQGRQTFPVLGVCSTGVGVIPASVYGQSATDQGRGLGGGIGGRVGTMFLSHLDPKKSAWWGVRGGTGLDLQLLYARVPTKIAPIDGDLCTNVAKSSHEVEARNVPELLVQIPFNLGFNVGLGGYVDPLTWRGIVVGLAWAPSYIHVGPWTASGSGQFSPLGAELTFDFTTLHATSRKRPPEPHLRMAATITVPTTVEEALLGTLAFGWVWY